MRDKRQKGHDDECTACSSTQRGAQRTVTTLLGTRCAAVFHPVCKSELKYSTLYPIKAVVPLCFDCTLLHDSVTLAAVTFTNFGSLGDAGSMLTSGARCSVLAELFSTCGMDGEKLLKMHAVIKN
jgi:hypothetical protein